MPDRIRFVIDTNVLVSGALRPESIPRRAFTRADQRGYPLLSQETSAEIEEVLERDAFDPYVSRAERQRFRKSIMRKAVFIDIEERVAACRDSDDDKFLEVAVNGQADVIITGDEDLTVLDPFREIPIRTPAEFLDMGLSE